MSVIGSGSPGLSSKSLPSGGGVPPFPAGAADNGLSVDPITGNIVLFSGVGNPLDAQLLSDRILSMDTFSMDFFRVGSESIFKLDPNNDEYRLGKLSTGAGIIVQAGFGGQIVMQQDNKTLFQGSPQGYAIGDPGFDYPYITGGNSGGAQEIFTINFADGGSLLPALRFEYTATDLFYEIGELNNIRNNTKMRIDDNAALITFTSNGIQTNDAAGLFIGGAWLLGQMQAAAVVLDATQYLECRVDGVAYKLALVN